jgi:hypothetical protein
LTKLKVIHQSHWANNQIKRVKVTKSLGLMIDETLTWDEQVTLITKKVNKGLNVMRRLRDFFDIKILTTVYHTLVQPYFDYCSQVWGGLGTTLCKKLQRLQNRAVRISLQRVVRSSICKFNNLVCPTWSAQPGLHNLVCPTLRKEEINN